MLSDKVKVIIDDAGNLPAFAWPGGYPLFYLNHDCLILCAKCAQDHEQHDETIIDYDANYEDPMMQCDNCNDWINPAYMSDEEAEAARGALQAEMDIDLDPDPDLEIDFAAFDALGSTIIAQHDEADNFDWEFWRTQIH